MTTLGIVLISYLYPSIRSLQIAVRSRSFIPERTSSLVTSPSTSSKTRDLSIFGASVTRSKAKTNARVEDDDMEDADLSELWKKSEIREMRFWIIYFTAFSIVESAFIIMRACVGVWPLSSRCRLGFSLYLMSTFFRGGESFLQFIDVMAVKGAVAIMAPAQIEGPESSDVVDHGHDATGETQRLLDYECRDEMEKEEANGQAGGQEAEEAVEDAVVETVDGGQQDNTKDDDHDDTLLSAPPVEGKDVQDTVSDASPGSSSRAKRTKRPSLRKRK